MKNKIETYFSKAFSIIILKNTIVASILYVIKLKLVTFKIKIDKVLNTDI